MLPDDSARFWRLKSRRLLLVLVVVRVTLEASWDKLCLEAALIKRESDMVLIICEITFVNACLVYFQIRMC